MAQQSMVRALENPKIPPSRKEIQTVMLKKFIPAIVAAVFALTPVHTADAWDEVCVHFPLWKTWFSGKFIVVSGFDSENDSLPAKFGPNLNRPRDFSDLIDNTTDDTARGAVYSSKMVVNQSRCVSIRDVDVDERFFVFILADSASISSSVGVVCETHSSNPNRFYHQTNRPYRKIWFESWGAVWSPKCKYTHESN